MGIICGGRKLFEKSFPSPVPPTFKNFQTGGVIYAFTLCVDLIFVRHPERRKGHGFVRWLSLCNAYQRLPLEVAKRHEGLRKQLSVVFPRV